MTNIIELAQNVARTNVKVLIEGETDTGKTQRWRQQHGVAPAAPISNQ